MTIHEVSREYGITPDTLRYYEKEGMIPPVTRVQGIRHYTQEDLRWVRLAKCMRDSGMSVRAIARYIQLFQQGDETILARLELLLKQKAQLEQKREKIDSALELLELKIERYREAEKTGVLQWKK